MSLLFRQAALIHSPNRMRPKNGWRLAGYCLSTSLFVGSLFLSGQEKANLALLPASYLTDRFQPGQAGNEPPAVKITLPLPGQTVGPNQTVRYAIQVEDREDGSSEYQEITPTEVLLEVVYLPDSGKAKAYLQRIAGTRSDPSGLNHLRTSDCFNCHAIQTKLQGPAFADVARRYPLTAANVNTLATRIRQGNSGVWGQAAMPPHPAFDETQAREIVRWILANAADPQRSYYAGTEGSFRTLAQAAGNAAGVYVLTASYQDHGSSEASGSRLRGQHSMVLKVR